MNARDEILAAMRKNMGRGALDAAAQAAIAERIARHEAGIIPKSAEGDRPALIERFTASAEKVNAVVTRVATRADVPEAVARYLADQNLPAKVIVSPDTLLTGLPWGTVPLVEQHAGVPDINDRVSITAPLAGISETGSLMLYSGSANAHIASFLPETNIAILPTDRLVGSMEQAWGRLRALGFGQTSALPRAVVIVTGPSRTGDIEQRIELGAHGPRRLHIVLVDEETG
ncbi:MAG: LutC/YkgG family protein [Alphaproteobacteria bacterium]